MAGLGCMDDRGLVHLDPQARALRDHQHAVSKAEAVPGQGIVAEIALLVVMDSEALLLDEGVVADRVHLQACRQRDRPQGAMRREGDVIGLGQ